MSAGTPKSDISQEQVVEIMRGERFVMLTSIAVDGALHSHPMTPQEVTDERAGEIAKELRKRIESELQYPSTIKITVIRESRFTETAT